MKESVSKSRTSRESVINHALKILRTMSPLKVIESKTMDIIELANDHGVRASCSPSGGAAGAVYIAGILTRNQLTLAEVAEASGISLETTRKYMTLPAKEPKIKRNP